MNKKRVIAVDFDDVVIETMIPFLKHYNDKYGVLVGPEHVYNPHSPAWDVDFREVVTRAEYFHSTDQKENAQFIPTADKALTQLAKTSELHIITGRPETIAGITREIINKYFPDIFTSVNFTGIFATTSITKSSICKQLGVTLFIDDHLGHAKDVASHGIDTLLFGDYPWNQTDDALPEHVRRVSGWDEVLSIIDNGS